MKNSLRQGSPWLMVVAASTVILAALIGYVSGKQGADLQMLFVLALAPIVLLVLSPRTAIVMLVVMLPFSGSTIIPRPIQNAVILGIPILLFVRIFIEWVGGKKAIQDLPWQYWLYLSVMFAAAIIGVSHLKEIPALLVASIGDEGVFGKKQYVLGFFAKQIMIGLLPLFVIAFAQNRKDLGWVAVLSLAGAVTFFVAMLYAFVISGASVTDLRSNRALFIALGTHSNTIGGLLVLPFAVALFMREHVRHPMGRLALVAVLLMILLGVLLTASRGALVAVIAVSGLYVVKYRRAGAAAMMVLVGAIALVLAPDSVKERLLMGLNIGSSQGAVMSRSADEISSGRLDFWAQLAPEVLNNPVIGNGLRSVLWSDYNKYGSGFKVNHPHNMYLSILLDTGVIGFFMFAALWWMVWKRSRALAADETLPNVARAYFAAGPGVMLAYAMFGLTNGHAYPSTDQLHLWLFVAAVLATPAPVTDNGAQARREKRARLRRMMATGYVSR